MKIKVALIINGSRKLKKTTCLTIDLLNNKTNLDCQRFTTEHPKHAVLLAQQSAEDYFKFIIAVGGDGTCNEVVNGIMLSTNRNDVVFGIIPNGTGNDFHKMLGDFKPEAFVNSIESFKVKSIDLIKVERNKLTQFALNIAGTGFDGHVVKSLSKMRGAFLVGGKISYGLSILKSFVTFKSIHTEITSEEFNYSGKTLMLAICNGKAFGHGLIINPMAQLDDGLLDVTLLGNVSFKDYILNISKLKKGELINHKEIFYFKTKNLKIKMSKPYYYTELDGELFGYGDVEFSIMREGLKLLF